MPNHPAFALAGAHLRGLDAGVLVLARHLLETGVEDDEVVEKIQQLRFIEQLRQRPVQQRTRFATGQPSLCLPLHIKLFCAAHGGVMQAL